MPVIKMSRGEILSFYGPAAFVVVKGVIDIFNKKVATGERVIVHKTRNYLVQALEESELDVNLGPGAQIQQVDPSEPYLERKAIAEDVIERGYRKIVIIGGVDTGKSTMTVLLANLAIEKGLKPAVIDGDVGQADIGPPCFITLSYPENQILWMRELKPIAMKFVGDIKPQHHISDIIYKIRDLTEKALNDHREPIIIDTDGWLNDEHALNYKYRLVAEIKPDALIVTSEESGLLFKRFENIGIKVYVSRAPANRRARSREERRMLRRDKYREFLEKAGERKIGLDSVLIVGHPLFCSLEIPKPQTLDPQVLDNILYIGKSGDTLVVLTKHSLRSEAVESLKKIYGTDKVKVYTTGFEKDLYVAVSDGSYDYPALISKIDFQEKVIILRTNFSGGIKIVKFSSIRLAEDYSEQIQG